MHVTIPGYFDREVAYVLHVLLKQNLGISNYILERKAVTNYIFKGPNGSLEINNAFLREKRQIYLLHPTFRKTELILVGRVYKIDLHPCLETMK